MANSSATKKILDFTDVKDRGEYNPQQVDAGEYTAKVTKVVETEAKDGTPMWVFTIVLDEHARYSYPYYCKLAANQLWKVKSLWAAAGITIPKKKLGVDPNKIVGKAIGVAMEDDEYEGRMKSVIAEIFPRDEAAPSEPVSTKKKPATDDEDEAEPEVADEDEADEEFDLDEV